MLKGVEFEMISNSIIAAILAVVLFISLRGSIKHFMGQGSCCGGGNSIVKEPDKKLKGPILKTKVFKIDGMHCENCTNRIKRALNSVDGVSAKLNLRKKEAKVAYDKDVDDAELTAVIERLGYKVISII